VPLVSKRSIDSSIAPRRKRRSYGHSSSAIIINEKSKVPELHTTELKNGNPIDDRPEYVDDHSTFGHWEGDLVICKKEPRLARFPWMKNNPPSNSEFNS